MEATGKKVLITGANSGIGFEAARILAGQGAHIILAVRSPEKGAETVAALSKVPGHGQLEVVLLDLASLASVAACAAEVAARHTTLDLLINNAGVMTPPYGHTEDGFELQLGINHLGHFALTGRLLPLLLSTPGSRVVTVSSLAHRKGRIDFGNLNGERGYRRMEFYRQSKLANLLFAVELDKRLKVHGHGVKSLACHPGISATNLFKFKGREAPGFLLRLTERLYQSAAQGARPTLHAALAPELEGGEYIGPDGKNQMKGMPTLETPAPQVQDAALRQRLFQLSEELTGVKFVL